jgi:6-phospho-beta-glucosidase
MQQPEGLEVRLQGPREEHLREVALFANDDVRGTLRVTWTPVLEDAVDGASIVLNQARIGGWRARQQDEDVAVTLGGVGDESLGLGGLRAVMRTLPFIERAASVLRRLAPAAWLLNLTNPSDLVARVWRGAGVRNVMSVCEQPILLAQEMARLAGDAEASTRFGFAGMSHVGWLFPPPDLNLNGLLAARPDLIPWVREWGAIPSPWRMIVEDAPGLARRQRRAPSRRAQQLASLARRLRSAIRRQAAAQYWDLLEQRPPRWYRSVVSPAILALLGGEPARLIVGLPHGDQLPGLDPEVVIETWTQVDAVGARPETLDGKARCRADVLSFGASRDLACAAIHCPEPLTLAQYASSDPFAPPPGAWHEWLRGLEPRSRGPERMSRRSRDVSASGEAH